MTRNELKKILQNERFDPRGYSLYGGNLNDTLCISQENGRWCFYYSERGSRFDERWFDSEGEACNYLLSALRSLPDYQTRLPGSPRS